jgi:MFS family permease
MDATPPARAEAIGDTTPHPTARTVLRRLSPTARRLIICRAARSVGQGALTADFAFYLAALHWTTVQMGTVYMGGLMFGALITLFSGPLSDAVGRKPFLIGYGIALVAASLVAFLTAQPLWLIAASVVGAFGRGANGAAGPFGPVEQAWLSDGLPESDFGLVYSINSAVGFGGMAAGAAIAALPSLWRHSLPGALSYRPLFLVVLIGALITLVLLFRMTDVPRPRADRGSSRVGSAERRHERGMLLRLIGINTLNGLAIGIIGPFMAFWFHLRFGEGPGAIGPVIAMGFVAAALASLWTGWLTRRLGAALSVVTMRLAGLVLLVTMPFAPSYGIAAACYVLRAACNQGTSGARQAVGLRLVGSGRRGLAASLNASSMQVPRAFGPVLGGLLLEANLLALPLLLAASLQAVYLALYTVAFRRIA